MEISPEGRKAKMSEFGEVCEKAARDAGKEILSWVNRAEVRKKGPSDLVTSADLAAQEVIRETVLSAFPDHAILAEENLNLPAKGDGTGYRWVADPLDGTTNFVHGVPHYAVSLALQHNDELITGAVYDPNAEECFTATRGQGAWLNGAPIQTSKVTELSESLAVVGFPYDLNRQSPDLLVFLEIAMLCQAIRRTGSAALNLCYLAAGRFDLFWSYSTNIWDVAAGVLLIEEAGGEVTGPTGGAFQPETGQFLSAANPELNKQLCEVAIRALA